MFNNLKLIINPGLSYQEILQIALKRILVIYCILGGLITFIGILEAIQLQQPQLAIIYGFVIMPVLLVTIMGDRVKFEVSALVLLLMLFCICIINLSIYGASGAAMELFLLIYFLSTLFFGMRGGFFSILTSLIPISIIGWLMASGRISASVDIIAINESFISWLTMVSVVFGIGTISIITITYIQRNLLSTIALNNQQKEELLQTNIKLSQDIAHRKDIEQNLQNRLNELTCLSAISRDSQKGYTVGELMDRAVHHILLTLPSSIDAVPLIEISGKQYAIDYGVDRLVEGIHAHIIVGGTQIGSVQINLTSKNKRVDLLGLKSLLNSVAEILSMAIDNRHNREEIQRHLKRLQTLRDIDQTINHGVDLRSSLNIIVAELIKQLDVDAACILLFNEENERLEYSVGAGFDSEAFKFTSLELGEGCAGEAAVKKESCFIKCMEETSGDFLRSPHFLEEKFKSYYGVPLISKGKLEGVLELFNRTTFNPDHEWVEFMNIMAGQTAIAIDSVNQFRAIQQLNQNLSVAYDATIEGWARALEMRDMETEGHSRRVTELTIILAIKLGVDEDDLPAIWRGALLHDIGKMGIPDAILRKPGALTENEWEIMRKHPTMAVDLLKDIDFLQDALDIPHYHHEKWDGTGYPNKLKGEDIPLAARIFAVVDVWDALSSDRPYRKAWPKEKILDYLQEEAGKQFDSKIVDAFFELKEIRVIKAG
ncbi:MAG: HD domain-containing protein [Anaerolineaceae bacterium]|nr:HD domain-containing protein [Anaerolineaceae bacterium]